VSICVAKAITVAGIVVMDVVRRPYMKRASALRVVANRTGMLDNTLVALVSVGFFLPVLWLATPVLAFADYALRPIPFGAGVVCLAGGLWQLNWRSSLAEKTVAVAGRFRWRSPGLGVSRHWFCTDYGVPTA